MILEHKGIPIFYTDQGKGDVLVLLHGFLENSSMWSSINSELTKKHRVICIDLLGHGKTGCLGYIHSMETMAEAVEVVVKHLKIESCVLIGHSMGGYVALAYVEKNPDKIKGLCLMNSTTQEDSIERKGNRDRAIKAVQQNHKQFIRLSITNLFIPKNRIIFSDTIELVKKEALKTPLQGIIAALEGMKIRKDRNEVLHNSDFKKMMIVGKKDPVLDYNSLIHEIENTETELVEFSDGHMSHIENKEELSYFIMHFIEKL